MLHRDPDKAFDHAIKADRLSADPDAANYAGRFMYMGTSRGVDHFKHTQTRRYLFEEGPTARFWIFLHDSPVKLTVRPGRALHWYEFNHHDEGWTSCLMAWLHIPREEGLPAFMHRHIKTDGSDCDGQLSTATLTRCDLGNLTFYRPAPHAADTPGPFDAFQFPQWETVKASQRDHSAEAMNY